MARTSKPKGSANPAEDPKAVQTAQAAPQEGQPTPEAPATPAAPQDGQEGPKTGQEAPQEGPGGQGDAQEGQDTTPEPSISPDPPVIVFVDHEAGLNLRDGPHQSFNALAVLEHKTPLEVIPLPAGLEVPGWAPVRCEVDGEALVGWVCTDFVRED